MKRIILFLLILLSADVLFGQKNEYPVSFDHIGLSVKDVNASAGFYKKLFGLREIINSGGKE